MAFGKIAIQTEDGDLKEYDLTKPTTSVGRQPGNDIVLNTTAVSRYHAQLDVAEGGVYLVDLGTVNGTFVNDAQIEANGRVLLGHGDVITLGDVALRFIAPEARSGTKRAAVSLTPEARSIEAPGVPFRLILDEPQQSVAPGARLQLTLNIENLTQQPLPVNIELGGLEPEWIKVNRRDATLEAGEQIQAIISVRPPRSSHTRPGVYALMIRVTQADEPSKSLEAVREIDVVAYAGLGVAMQRSRSGDQFHLAVQNQGNQPTRIALDGYQRQKQLKFRFQPRELSLQAGETKQASLTVSPASGRPFGSPLDIAFAVVARSLDEAAFQAPLSARYTMTPSWPNWLLGAALPMIFGGLLVLALLAVGLVSLGVLSLPFLSQETPAPSPTQEALTPGPVGAVSTLAPAYAASIEYFRVSQDAATYKTMGEITLEWSATGYERIELHQGDENGPLIELRPEDISARQRRIAIEDLAFGPNDFTLVVAGSDDRAVTRRVSIQVTFFTCTLAQGTVITTRPGPSAPAAPTPEAMNENEGVIVIGRAVDNLWAYVIYDYDAQLTLGQMGWVAARALQCPPGAPDISQYVPVDSPDITPPSGATAPSAGATPTSGQQPGPRP